ncbi:MAG: hypothetical protein ABSB86_11045 [Bryobacteraceae bacterium]|jgi:hypothetical protein
MTYSARTDISLKQEIIQTLPRLPEELGLRFVEDLYLSEHAGDSYVTLQSGGLLVRFVRDRGQVWVEVAPVTAPTSWLPVTFVLEALQGKSPQVQFNLLAAASLLRDHFSELEQALGPRLSETQREMERLKAERLDVLMRSPGKLADS